MKMSTIARRSAPFAVGLAGILAVTGCSAQSTSEETDSTETLTVWFPGSSQPEIDLVTNTLVPEFESETGIDVEVTFVDWGDLSPKLNAAFAAGTGPDVFGHGPAAAADLVANDRVLDLDDDVASWPEDDQDDLASALTGGQVDGKQYLIPLSVSGWLVAYREDLLDAAGIDPSSITTWGDLKDAAELLTERDGDRITRAGLLLGTAAQQRTITFNGLISGAGGQLMNDDGSEPEFDSSEGVQALTYFADLYNGDDAVATNLGEDYVNSAAAQQPLVTGSAAMTLLTSQAVSQITIADPDLKVGVLPALQFTEPATFGGAGAGLFINADSEAKDAAWEFITFMSSPDISTDYAEGTGTIPIRASAVDSDYVKDSPALGVFINQMPYFVPNPNVPQWTQIRDILDSYLEQALAGQATPEDALKRASDEVSALVG